MAEVRRTQRVIESVDPVTGETVYTDASTGDVVVVDDTGHTTVVTGSEPARPASEQVVTQRVVSGPVAASEVHTQESEVYTDDPYAYRRARAYRIQQAIYLIFGVLQVLLGIRFVLRLLAANPNSGFASMVYGITAPFMAPFVGVFGEPSVGGTVIEWNALVAIVVYALIAWVLVKVVWLVGGESRTGVRTSRVNTRIDR